MICRTVVWWRGAFHPRRTVISKPLSFKHMLGLLQSWFESVPERRIGRNIQYAMRDAGLRAFAVFFMQAPSFLAHQRDMPRALGRNNANSLLGPHAVPSDAQIRNLLDPLAPEQLQVPYWEILAGLEVAGELAR